MNTDQIRYFLEIEKYNSFTTAAQYLHMNQSTISRQIAELEKELGADLFIRGSRKVDLTEAGKIFLKEGAEILARIERLCDKIDQVGRGNSGRLTIGLPVNIFGLTTKFSNLNIVEEYPDAEFSFVVMNLEDINTALVCGDIDIAFTYEFAVNEIIEEISYKLFLKKPFVFFTNEKSELCKKERVELSDIISERLVLLKTNYQPSFLVRIISKDAFEGRKKVKFCINYESMMMEVASGGGIGVLPEIIFETSQDYYMIHKLTTDEGEHDINYIIAHNKNNTNPLIKSFYKFCIANMIL